MHGAADSSQYYNTRFRRPTRARARGGLGNTMIMHPFHLHFLMYKCKLHGRSVGLSPWFALPGLVDTVGDVFAVAVCPVHPFAQRVIRVFAWLDRL